MTLELDGETRSWEIKDAKTITILKKEDWDTELVIEFNTDDTQEFVGTFLAPEELRGKEFFATEWEESLDSLSTMFGSNDSFLNQFQIYLPKLKDINAITTMWLYYSFYDYSPETQGEGQLSKLPSCIWRSTHSSDIYEYSSLDSGLVEDKEAILCTTYEERMSKDMPFAADPSVFKDASGDNWMVMGNFWNGIYVV